MDLKSIKNNNINNLIYSRNLLIKNPPHPILNPPLVDNLRNESSNSLEFLNISPENELYIANYWYIYIYKNKEGLNFENNMQHSLKWFNNKFPNKPWLEGIKYNITHENKLIDYSKAISKDCLEMKDIYKIEKENTKANIKMIDIYFNNSNIYPNYTKKWFNNNTGPKAND